MGVSVPQPKGEKLSAFIGRFVKSKREENKFPEAKQRLAVGYAESRELARKEKRT
jgi:hypothetical protein